MAQGGKFPMHKHRIARRMRAATAGIAVLGGMIVPATASAYWSTAGGSRGSAQAIAAGSGYHGNIRVTFFTYDGWNAKPEVCAKAITQANNIRSGSGCSYNTYGRRSLLSSTDPISAGYGYWGGSGGAITVRVWECSPSDEYYCLNGQ